MAVMPIAQEAEAPYLGVTSCRRSRAGLLPRRCPLSRVPGKPGLGRAFCVTSATSAGDVEKFVEKLSTTKASQALRAPAAVPLLARSAHDGTAP